MPRIFRPPFPALNFRSRVRISFSQMTKKSALHGASPFYSFCRSGDHNFQNFLTFKPFRRRLRPVYCSNPERKAKQSAPGLQPARVPARRVLQVSSRDPPPRPSPRSVASLPRICHFSTRCPPNALTHGTPLQRFKNSFGICGNAYSWFETYLKHREQEVVINEVRSSIHTPVTGVPQGSVVGPLMFIMYTTPLYDIIISHGVSGMLYADDTQLYVSFKPDEIQDYVNKIQCCITDIKKWANANSLKLNDSKTEVIHITSRFRRRLKLPLLMVESTAIAPTDKVKNLCLYSIRI